MIYLLGVLLIIILIISYYFEKKDILSPSFIFILGFSFQSLWAIVYSKTWNLGLHANTFWVIFGGVLVFFSTTQILKFLYKKQNNKLISYKLDYINIMTWKKLLTIVFVILVSAIYLIYVFKGTGVKFAGLSSIPEAITQYDKLTKFSDVFSKVQVPAIVANLRIVVIAIGYWFLYVVINNCLYNKKFDGAGILVVLLSAINSTLSGSRGSVFMLIISGFLYFFIIKNKQSKFESNINYKTILILVCIAIFMLSMFVPLARLMGRNVSTKTTDYLSIYVGAEVKNLDIFLQKKDKIVKNEIWGSQTFYSLIQTIGSKTNIIRDYKPYRLDLPFNTINGKKLGNVYTTFYPYIYDFGYNGFVLLVVIMAIISQFVYERIKRIKFSKSPPIIVLVYGTIFSCLLLSFFSNKFYENIFSMSFLKKIIIWYICNYIFCKFEIKKRVNHNEKINKKELCI